MKPRIFERDAFMVAGVMGSGDETGKTWDALRKLTSTSPLANKVGEDGYEVRMYSGEGAGEVHVGFAVKNSHVPPEYKVLSLPARTYAEFEIRPAKGYESSNAEMNRWLAEHAGTYREALLDGRHYAIEVYDARYKGDRDPNSVVGILMPVIPL